MNLADMNLTEWAALIAVGGGLLTFVSIELYEAIKLHNELKKEEKLNKEH